MPLQKIPSIFLSHSSADKPFTRRLAHRLGNAGATVWLDEAEMRIGDSLIAKLSSAIEGIDYVAAVISQASVASKWVEHELRLAMTREVESSRVVVLPLLIEDVSIPAYLKDKLYADFRSPELFEHSFHNLLVALAMAEPHPYAENFLHVLPDRVALQQFSLQYLASMSRNPNLRNPERVVIFWHEAGLTRVDAVHLVADLADSGILANMIQHSSAKTPDAVFVSKGASIKTVTLVFQGLPVAPTFIFPYSHPSSDYGCQSAYSISVGLRSDFPSPSLDGCQAPRTLSPSDFSLLANAETSDEMKRKLLNLLCS